MVARAVLWFILARLREPSTHAGLSGAAVAVGQIFPEYATVANSVGVILGGLAALVKDRSDKLAKEANAS